MSLPHAIALALALVLALPARATAPSPAPEGRHLAAEGRRKVKRKKKKKVARRSKKQTKNRFVRPGDQKASTSGLEEKLKQTEEPSEQAPLAPAKLEQAPGAAVTKDAQADKARDEAIAQIQKILPKQRDPNVQADLLFQLAELWWEKSRYVKLNEEMPAYQKAADDWMKCRQQKGNKACGLEPRPNNRKSELYRKNAVELYTLITHKYPHYARLDEIFYILAYNKYDYAQGVTSQAEKKKATNEALDAYRQLIARYPHSKFIASAFVQLGNYYFDQNQLAPARKAFDEAFRLRDPKTQTFAEYKLAWCDINSGDWDNAFKRFKDVIVRGSRSNDNDPIRLKSEALRDIVRVFGERQDFDTAIQFFEQYAGHDKAWRYINMLANYNFNAGGEKQETAIKFYRYMIDKKPMDPSAPEWQSKIVLSYDKLSERDKVRDEMKILVNNYKPGSSWYEVNKNDKFHIQSAYSLTEEALYNLVTDYHQEAIKTKSVATYKLARDMYAEYIENFPDSERAYEMRFYYAEILYALEEYQAAYEQYLKVAEDGSHNDFKKVSATNMLLAAEKLVDIEAGRYTPKIDVSNANDTTTKIDEDKDKGQIEKTTMKVKIDAKTPPQPLTTLELQLVKACDDYTRIIPNADDEARVRLRAAVIYFDKVHYVEAAKRFDYIINKWPEDKTSAAAASLILESLEVKEKWTELNKLARKFAANKRLLAGQGKEELKKKLPVYIEGSQFKLASEVNDKDKNYPKAAKMFRDFVKEFPKSKFAPIALAKAFYIYQDAKQLDTAIQVGEQMFKEYPKADSAEWKSLPNGTTRDKDILPDLLFALAKCYERTADFDTAAAKYLEFVKAYPKDERVADAQFNAAHWYEGLGESANAIKAYDDYIKIFDKEKPDQVKKLNLPPAAGVFYEEALIYERDKNWGAEFNQLDQYLRKYHQLIVAERWREINATYKIFLAALKEPRLASNPMKYCDEIVKTYNGSGFSQADKDKETTKLAVAHCRFLQIEPEFDAYKKLEFKSPATLKRDLEKKKALMGKLTDEYKKIVEYGNGDYAIAALVRMSMLPKLFSKALTDAPMPKGLDPDQQEMYRAQLENIAFQYEQPAVDGIQLALKTAFEKGIYNEWTLKAEDMMKEFKPDAFDDVKEFPLKGTEYFFTAGYIKPTASAPANGSGGN